MIYSRYIGSQSYYESNVSAVDVRGNTTHVYRVHEWGEAYASECLTPPEEF
jgi:hypothetical protein